MKDEQWTDAIEEQKRQQHWESVAQERREIEDRVSMSDDLYRSMSDESLNDMKLKVLEEYKRRQEIRYKELQERQLKETKRLVEKSKEMYPDNERDAVQIAEWERRSVEQIKMYMDYSESEEEK